MVNRYQRAPGPVYEDLRRLVIYRQVRQVEAVFREPVTLCADGETFRGKRLTARVLPGAARMLLPRR